MSRDGPDGCKGKASGGKLVGVSSVSRGKVGILGKMSELTSESGQGKPIQSRVERREAR